MCQALNERSDVMCVLCVDATILLQRRRAALDLLNIQASFSVLAHIKHKTDRNHLCNARTLLSVKQALRYAWLWRQQAIMPRSSIQKLWAFPLPYVRHYLCSW